MKAGSKRYWRVLEDNTIKCIVLAETEPHPEGWTRGFPPKSPEEKIKHAERMRQVHAGKEKSSLQRQRMAMAKIGKKKSESHVNNMRQSHLRRHIRILEIQKYYSVDYFSASSYEAKLKKSKNKPEWYVRLLAETETITEFKDK